MHFSECFTLIFLSFWLVQNNAGGPSVEPNGRPTVHSDRQIRMRMYHRAYAFVKRFN